MDAYVAQQQALAAIPATTGYEVVRSASPSSALRVVEDCSEHYGQQEDARAYWTCGRPLAGAGLVLLLEFLDKRLRNSSRAEEMFGYPVVIEIPASSRPTDIRKCHC